MTLAVVHAGIGNVTMMSVRATHSDHGDAPSVGARDGSARLSLKPKGCVRGALDGAWWPRSTDPAAPHPPRTEEITAEQALTMAAKGHDPDIAAPVGDHYAPVSEPVSPA